MRPILPTSITDHPIIIAAAAVVVIYIIYMNRRLRLLKNRLEELTIVAQDAATAAALATPGGIDPEIVLNLLRSGQAVTLDSVNNLMETARASQPK